MYKLLHKDAKKQYEIALPEMDGMLHLYKIFLQKNIQNINIFWLS